MLDWINPLFAWLSLGGVGIAGLLALAYFFPPFRKVALAVAAAIAAGLAIYAKGSRDQAATEAKRREKVVKKAQEKFDEIDARPDSDRDVDKRLRDGNF